MQDGLQKVNNMTLLQKKAVVSYITGMHKC